MKIHNLLSFGLILSCASILAMADASAMSTSQQGVLVVGVQYDPPPFVAGSKVRTPEGLETALVDSLAKQLHLQSKTVQADAANRAQLLKTSEVDFVLASVPEADTKKLALEYNALITPTGYKVGPMAIMRTDTDIKSWSQLKGRTVCLAKGGLYVGMLASKYGAIEQVYPAPADSLLALRTGVCDAAVHDDMLLKALLKLPEWKKFSASLPVGPQQLLVFVASVSSGATTEYLGKMTEQWKVQGHFNKLTKLMARDIAFEVYLDQNIPDCH